MKKTILALLLHLCVRSILFSQPFAGQMDIARIPSPVMHYQDEYDFDTIVNSAAWSRQTKGMHVSFASTEAHYFRKEVPGLEKENSTVKLTGWKGERVNTLILVWSPDTINQVNFVWSDLTNANRQIIKKEEMQLQLIRYVASNYPYGAKDVNCDVTPYKDVYMMPDRFEDFERFDIPAKSTRPVWLSLNIPSTILPGSYSGNIEVRSTSGSKTLQVEIIVQNQLLPPPHDWKHRLDLWQNPWVIAWTNHVEPWSAAHKLLLKKHLKLYADAGGKYITTYAVHSPWSDNSYMIEGGMIEWIKQKNGAWKFDYKIFDEYVQLAIETGIDKAITLYTPVPWGNRFRYKDAITGTYITESWAPESDTFRKVWNVFLTDLKSHLLKKGWFKKTYLGINENAMEQTLAAIQVIRQHSKDWRITYAGDWHPELDLLLNDYSFLYGKESDAAKVKERAERGFTTSYYICCNPPVPNNFVFSPPAEGRWLGWYTTAHGYDGFLRWAYDAWPADPSRDARHVLWPAGDCFLVYPGGKSCIRFEKMREGIVDFEKIRILRDKASKSNDRVTKDLLLQLNNHLATLLHEKDFVIEKIAADIDKGKTLLNQLSEKLAGK